MHENSLGVMYCVVIVLGYAILCDVYLSELCKSVCWSCIGSLRLYAS